MSAALLTHRLPLYLALFALTQCSKCKNSPNPTDPASQLPPATQTGANTFGCLVNGHAYTPAGRTGLGANFLVGYDPTFQGGDLVVATYAVSSPTSSQYLLVGGAGIASPRSYTFGPGSQLRTSFQDASRPQPCDGYDSRVSGTFSKGRLTITRLDQRARIIAGTFDCVLVQPGCDTLRITQGRFDGTY
ncbi:MAG: hypothetical protein EOO63_18395 [Hymenobacter sp.]|nr:MAG: hypothetical protein EOO63_18395 [Hymenobacter sp.]